MKVLSAGINDPLPARRCAAWAVTAASCDGPFRCSIYYAGCGCHPLACIACAAMSPAFVEACMISRRLVAMCARAVSRDAGGAVGSGRASVRGGVVGRLAVDVSLRPAHRRNSPVKKRASLRRRSRPRHCARCRSGCVPATRRALPADAAAAAAARRSFCWSAWALLGQGGKLTGRDAGSLFSSRTRYVCSFLYMY